MYKNTEKIAWSIISIISEFSIEENFFNNFVASLWSSSIVELNRLSAELEWDEGVLALFDEEEAEDEKENELDWTWAIGEFGNDEVDEEDDDDDTALLWTDAGLCWVERDFELECVFILAFKPEFGFLFAILELAFEFG